MLLAVFQATNKTIRSKTQKNRLNTVFKRFVNYYRKVLKVKP